MGPIQPTSPEDRDLEPVHNVPRVGAPPPADRDQERQRKRRRPQPDPSPSEVDEEGHIDTFA